MGILKRGNFIMKGMEPELINTYWCVECQKMGITHEVIDIPGPATDAACHWGAGLPTTLRHCTGCEAEDGPWVSSKLVGGFW